MTHVHVHVQLQEPTTLHYFDKYNHIQGLELILCPRDVDMNNLPLPKAKYQYPINSSMLGAHQWSIGCNRLDWYMYTGMEEREGIEHGLHAMVQK